MAEGGTVPLASMHAGRFSVLAAVGMPCRQGPSLRRAQPVHAPACRPVACTKIDTSLALFEYESPPAETAFPVDDTVAVTRQPITPHGLRPFAPEQPIRNRFRMSPPRGRGQGRRREPRTAAAPDDTAAQDSRG